MDENVKQENYINSKCPNCGSELKFLPNSMKLKCVSCDSTFDIESLGKGKLENEEEDYLEALKQLENEKHERKVQRTIHCSDCGGLILINDKTVSTNCPFCGSHRVVTEDKEEDVLNIKGIIPFKIEEESVKTDFKKWIKKRFWAPSKFKTGVTSPTYAAFYIPYYTFDSDTVTKYHALRGDYYYVTRTVRTKDGTRTVTERRIRWTPVSGVIKHDFDDLLVPGTNSVLNKYIVKISNYDFNLMEKYQEKFMLGYSAEKPSINVRDGFARAKDIMDDTIRRECISDIGGDTYSNLNYKINFSNVTFKQIMAPIYNGSYNYKNKTYNFVCNGQNGQFSGSYPKSALKITIFVLILIALFVGIAVLAYIYYIKG